MNHNWIRQPFVGLVMGGVALWCTRRRLFPKFKKCDLVQPLQVVYFSIYGGLFVGSGLIGMLGLKRGEWLLLPASLLACNNRLAPFNTPLGGHVPRAGGPFIIVIKPAPSDPNNPTILRMPILARALFISACFYSYACNVACYVRLPPSASCMLLERGQSL